MPLEVEVHKVKNQVQALFSVHHVAEPERERRARSVPRPLGRRSGGALPPHLTMFTCCSSFSSEISRIAVGGTPSSSCSRRIFFSAIMSPVSLCRALYTTPAGRRTAVGRQPWDVGAALISAHSLTFPVQSLLQRVPYVPSPIFSSFS